MHKLYCEKNELSLGQLYLLEICDKRKITQFWNQKLNNKFSIAYLMKIATGKVKTPSLNFIYSMLEIVSPTDWFYQETEGKKSVLLPKEKYVTDIKKSINYRKLVKLREDKLLNRFCIENFGERSQHYMVKFMHILSGRYSVSPDTIRELKETFPVDDWFIETR